MAMNREGRFVSIIGRSGNMKDVAPTEIESVVNRFRWWPKWLNNMGVVA